MPRETRVIVTITSPDVGGEALEHFIVFGRADNDVALAASVRDTVKRHYTTGANDPMEDAADRLEAVNDVLRRAVASLKSAVRGLK